MVQQSTLKPNLLKILTWTLVVGSVLGVLASSVILIDKIKLLENPNFVPSCSVNPIISCGSVMSSSQSHIFGFANPIIGLVSFGGLFGIGMALLAGARFKRWFWLGLQAGAFFGIGFVHWLFFQSVYRINALCIYCMIVWAVTIPIFWYTTLHNFDKGYLKTPKKLTGVVSFARRHHLDILVLWFAVLTALILEHFWYYFGPS